MPDNDSIADYISEIAAQLKSGYAGEHGYRPALARLMSSFEDVSATNDPRRTEHGNPDMVFYKTSNHSIILGRAEAKDISIDLDKTAKTEQLRRYAGYEKLFLTNGVDFIFYQNGEEYRRISIGKVSGHAISFDQAQFGPLLRELQAFLTLKPENIRNGKRLAIIMGGKARRIRDNVETYLKQEDNERNQELEKIFKMMKTLLVHDLTAEKFADMYAQTLVYGLFAARYSDKTPDDFSREEARELIPASNPFLREFFDHIAGPRFDSRLAHIVDELCEVFTVSDVNTLIQKHLMLFEVEDDKDPIIHFYEDFLKEYDPAERKKMGAYYTPIPVVRFIIRQVDEILKKEFGLNKGLADTSKITKEMQRGQKVHVRNPITGKMEYTDTPRQEFHRVQILDPAVGTATFLNEAIKYIHKGFDGQEGRWPAYVEQDLLPRLHGFELMMAPYTIAHLKLGITLQETGITDFKQRLGVYLTNTLEEGIKRQQDLFSFGLAEAVSLEAAEAAKIKKEKPIMVIIGNPPYNNSSSNNSSWIINLIKDYKKDVNETNINSLSDDYVKFIRFAEFMVENNEEGIVALITNNSFIDGISHSSMRKHLIDTFDSIYVLNLHGDVRKKETTSDGSVDENVFDIMKGVSINIFVRTKQTSKNKTNVYTSDIQGTRKYKFTRLNQKVDWQKISPQAPHYYMSPKNLSFQKKYDKGILITDLFIKYGSGIKFRKDNLLIKNFFEYNDTKTMLTDMQSYNDNDIYQKYKFKDTADWELKKKRHLFLQDYESIIKVQYKPFDTRYAYYPLARASELIPRGDSRIGLMKNMLHENQALTIMRSQVNTRDFKAVFCVDQPIDLNYYGFQSNIFPLYTYHTDASRIQNFDLNTLSQLGANLHSSYEPEDTFDYIYAVLHSPMYREMYKEFLKIDFPRVPVPRNDTDFKNLTALGRKLRELHLLTPKVLDNSELIYPFEGTDVVERIEFISQFAETFWNNDNKNAKYKDISLVRINDTQFFGNVPEKAWNFYIGGYQPAQKWLKDRKGRKLSNEDIEHYQNIIKILVETDKIMKQIDKTWKP